MANRIWKVTNHGKTKYFKTEGALISQINSYWKKARITILEEVEEFDSAIEFKDYILKKRERDEGLKIVLDDDDIVQKMVEFRNRIFDLPDSYLKKIVKRILLDYGNNKETLLKILRETGAREWILLRTYNDVEWYKTLLAIHNFRFPENINPEHQVNLENFKVAKAEIKKNKK